MLLDLFVLLKDFGSSLFLMVDYKFWYVYYLDKLLSKFLVPDSLLHTKGDSLIVKRVLFYSIFDYTLLLLNNRGSLLFF